MSVPGGTQYLLGPDRTGPDPPHSEHLTRQEMRSWSVEIHWRQIY